MRVRRQPKPGNALHHPRGLTDRHRAMADIGAQIDANKSPHRVKRGSVTLSSSNSPALFPQSASPSAAHAQDRLSDNARRLSHEFERARCLSASEDFVCPISFVTETTRRSECILLCDFRIENVVLL